MELVKNISEAEAGRYAALLAQRARKINLNF
jgi:hypothetical protein